MKPLFQILETSQVVSLASWISFVLAGSEKGKRELVSCPVMEQFQRVKDFDDFSE
jgi:hypothetical protein